MRHKASTSVALGVGCKRLHEALHKTYKMVAASQIYHLTFYSTRNSAHLGFPALVVSLLCACTFFGCTPLHQVSDIQSKSDVHHLLQHFFQ